jgi:protein TonB
MPALLLKTPALQAALAGSVALHTGVLLAMRDPPARAAAAVAVVPAQIDLAALADDPAPVPATAAPPSPARHPQVSSSPRPSPHEPVPAATSAQAGDDIAPAPPARPRFVLSLGAPPGPSAAPAGGSDASMPAPIYAPDAVDVPPRFLAWSPPLYPAAAAAAGIETDVPVDVIIDAEGAVTDVRLPRHVGYGLDEAAVAAARSYRFSRGLRAGRPVRVRMRCTVTFRLN